MSRRTRRKKGAGKNPILGKVLIGLGALLLLAVGLAYMGLRAYLHSDGFRKFLSAQLSKVVKIQGDFAPFNWDGMAVETQRFEGTGQTLISDLFAERISTEVGFGGVSRGVWEVKSTRINRLQLSLNLVPGDSTAVVIPELPKPKKPTKKQQPGWVPKKVELESLEIGDLGVQLITSKGLASAKGMSVYVLPTTGQNAYKAEVTGGKVTVPFTMVPEMEIERIEVSYRSGSMFVNQAEVSGWENGRIEASGESNFTNKIHAYQGKLDGITCNELLNENWARRLTGDVSSTFQFTKRENYQKVSGDLVIQNGTLTALPVLDALAAYADTRRFRMLQLSDAKTSWEYVNGEIILSNLVIGSEGLIRLEGRLTIRGEELDGTFQLGLVPGTLAKIPGAETHVFQSGKHGLLWAPFRLTGTLSDPKEDLSQRLAAAAGARMFEVLPETGEKVLKYTTNVLGEAPSKILDKSGKILDKGTDVIKDATDVFKGILGN
jgi:hypothetical protein